MTIDELSFWLGEEAETVLREYLEREALRNPPEDCDE